MLLNDPFSKTWTQNLKKVAQFTSTLTKRAVSGAIVWGIFREVYMPLTPCQTCWFLKSLPCFLGLSWLPFSKQKSIKSEYNEDADLSRKQGLRLIVLELKCTCKNWYRWSFLENQNSYGYLQPCYMQAHRIQWYVLGTMHAAEDRL